MSFTFWLSSLKTSFVAASARRNNRNSRRATARQRWLLLETLEDRLAPATLIVNTNADGHPTNGTLSLRDAISAVNAGNASGFTAGEMNQVSGTFGVNDTIEFSAALSGDTITLNGSALAISNSVTITGLGANNLTISGNNESQVFTVASGTQVSIVGLTVEDGNSGFNGIGGGIVNSGTLTVTNCTISDNTGYNYGGGIANNGILTVSNSTLSGNSAVEGVGANGFGGGIGNNGTLTMSNSTLSDNSASFGGGIGIGSSNADITVSNSTISDNLASSGSGGGIVNSGMLTVANSTLSGNLALTGGAGISNSGTLTVINSTLSGNSAVNGGGGGIDNSGTLTVTNSTLSGNSGGGGIANSSSAILNNTIVANNTSGGDLHLGSVSSSFNGSYDLIGDGSDLSSFSHSLQGNPLLAPLGNYGGPTQTLPLLPGSPAIDAGSPALATAAGLTTDQRGQPRSVNGAVDLGAFESQGFTLSVTSGGNQSAAVNTNFATPLTVTVTANNASEPVNGGVVAFTAPSAGASATLSANPATISGGSASVTAAANVSAGAYTVTVSGSGVSMPAAFDLTNTSPPPASPPVVNAIAGQLVADGGTLSFTVTASSPDGSPLTFALAAGAPAGATLNAQSGAFSWSPSEFNGIVPGSYSLTVTAAESDAPARAGAATFTVTVGPSSTDLGTGLTVRIAVADGLTQSTEFYSNFVTAAYNKYLGRAPEASGLAYWVNLMQHQGLTDEQLEAGFIGSQEFLGDHGGGGRRGCRASTRSCWAASPRRRRCSTGSTTSTPAKRRGK